MPDDDGLTAKQEMMLEVAHKQGYWAVPRGASLEDLAQEMGLSAQAVSERLRRATKVVMDQRFAERGPQEVAVDD